MADNNPRYVSRLTKNTLALILAGGRGSRLYELTNWRAKPALYFGGKYRIILDVEMTGQHKGYSENSPMTADFSVLQAKSAGPSKVEDSDDKPKTPTPRSAKLSALADKATKA